MSVSNWGNKNEYVSIKFDTYNDCGFFYFKFKFNRKI